VRVEAARLCLERLVQAFAEVDTSNGGPSIRVDDDILARQRRYDIRSLTIGWQWRP
jgi:hypothetical protein